MSDDLVKRASLIGVETAGPAANDVDTKARFPSEAVAAMRVSGLFAAGVPRPFGGEGARVVALAEACAALGQHCASSAMVLAMHYTQVFSLCEAAGRSEPFANYLRKVAFGNRLIASVTSEVGPSGDMRSSVTAVETVGERYRLTKKATTLSYGQYADDLLITARRNTNSPANDQVLVLAQAGEYQLQDLGSWNTLGMRGTCSQGCTVHADGEAWEIVPQPFSEIATQVMTPTSHILWSACWLGIATDAVAKARAGVRSKARANPGVMSRSAHRTSEIVATLQRMRHDVMAMAREYDACFERRDWEHLAGISFVLRINNLKLSASRLVVEIVSEAMGICGIAAYKNDSPASLGRHLRDAFSAALMINNDRIIETNASLLSIHKGD